MRWQASRAVERAAAIIGVEPKKPHHPVSNRKTGKHAKRGPPASTLYSAITKEISTKGKESRFKKTDRGRFARS